MDPGHATALVAKGMHHAAPCRFKWWSTKASAGIRSQAGQHRAPTTSRGAPTPLTLTKGEGEACWCTQRARVRSCQSGCPHGGGCRRALRLQPHACHGVAWALLLLVHHAPGTAPGNPHPQPAVPRAWRRDAGALLAGHRPGGAHGGCLAVSLPPVPALPLRGVTLHASGAAWGWPWLPGGQLPHNVLVGAGAAVPARHNTLHCHAALPRPAPPLVSKKVPHPQRLPRRL